MGALKALVSFYTMFHMNITQEDMDAMESRFHLTPLVGLIFGLLVMVEVAFFFWARFELGFGSGFAMAVVVLLTVYAGSKFLHFDGLTDFGDGMIVSGEQSDHIRALKDTLVGAGGIGVAMITVLCSVAFYSMYESQIIAIAILPMIEVLVKHSMVTAASLGMPGNGMAARQVERTTVRSAVLSAVITVALCSLFLVLCYGAIYLITGIALQNYLECSVLLIVVGLLVSTLVGVLMARNANRVFGMVNGDILGATNEVSRPFLAFFLLLAFMILRTVI